MIERMNKMKDSFNLEFLYKVLNGINSNIRIINMETDEIVYMNEYCKKIFQIENPEGKLCWKVLQKGREKRCEFCKRAQVEKLGEGKSYFWRDHNTVTGKTYLNEDRIEYMGDARYHVQSSIDITEYVRLCEESAFDELTGVLNRRTGKEKLNTLLQNMEKDDKFVVVLYDVNELKWVNDTYGHLEGDRFLAHISQNVKKKLSEPDFLFRLSGDEFVIIFINQDMDEVDLWMKRRQQELIEESGAVGINYHVTFSYGMATIHHREKLTVSDVLSIVDSQMYIQKKGYYAMKSQSQMGKQHIKAGENISFQYNKEYLFDVLDKSIDDYVFVGDLKTGKFKYSYKMRLDFGLPSQELEDAIAFWRKKIHPEDVELFLHNNQAIADGSIDRHTIVYRAKNIKGEWNHLMCRGYMVRDSEGKPDLFGGIIRNLDKTEKDINEELRLISDSSSDGIFKASMTEGFPVLYANEAYYELHGYTKKQMMEELNNHADVLVYEGDRERIKKEIADMIEQQRRRGILEYRICKRNGSIAWVYVNAGISYDIDGTVMMLGIIMDITEKRKLEERILHTQQLFKVAKNNIGLNIWEFDFRKKQIIQMENSSMGDETIIENIPETLIEAGYYHPDYIETVRKFYKQLEDENPVTSITVRVKSEQREKEYRWEKITYTIMSREDRKAVWAVGISEDVTTQKEIEIRIFEEERSLKTLTKDVLCVFQVNLSQNWVEKFWNYIEGRRTIKNIKKGYEGIYHEILNTIADEDEKARFHKQYSPEEIDNAVRKGRKNWNFEFQQKQKNGMILWVRLSIRVIVSPEAEELFLVGDLKNIDWIKRRELSLKQKAERDDLTGLYNFITARLLIEEILTKKQRESCALVLLDVDNFKEINQKNGFFSGDEVLKAISNKLTKNIPFSCIKARTNGDMLLLFCYNLNGQGDIRNSIEKIRQDISRKYTIENKSFEITVSAGMIVNFTDIMTYEQMYQCASYALQIAKREGKNRLFIYQDIEKVETGIQITGNSSIGKMSVESIYQIPSYIFDSAENYEVQYDKKIGLSDYQSYMNYIEQINKDSYSSFGILGIRIADLKNYNKIYGTKAGDYLLKLVVDIIIELFGKNYFFRISEGDFYVICLNITYEKFMQKCEVIKERLKKVHNTIFSFAMVWGDRRDSIEKLQKQVEEKLQIVCTKNFIMKEKANEYVENDILYKLNNSIESGEFHTFLQPKANVQTGEICGAEALIRYFDKKKGIIMPGQFLPQIEEMGFIRLIDLFILKDVCRILKKWLQRGWKPFPISLNYSRSTILEPDILEETNLIVESAGVPKELIQIEITETIGSVDLNSLKEVVQHFVEAGYKIALDDFGAEYSNMHILYSLNLSILKLDRRIISDIYHNEGARIIVKNLIDACKKLQIECVAEGVETIEQVSILKETACDVIQGYFLNKPLPEQEFEKQYCVKN